MTYHGGSEDNENANQALGSYLFLREDFHQEDGHSSDLHQKRGGILLMKAKHKEKWDRVAELMMLKFGESKHPVFRSKSLLSRGVLKSKGGGKLSIHFCADEGTIETVFRTIVSVYQLSIYGAVSDVCVRNTVLVKQEREDPYWQDNLTHCSRHQIY